VFMFPDDTPWGFIKNHEYLAMHPDDLIPKHNRASHIRHKCRKATVLSSHMCLFYTGVEKMNNL
jgi:hypothetical protein